jgi:hypothetical protein
MIIDPLNLRETPPPSTYRDRKAALSEHTSAIFQRINNPDVRDSMEVKIALLSHLIIVGLKEMKETIVNE